MNQEPTSPPVSNEPSGVYPMQVPLSWQERLMGEGTMIHRYITWFETIGQKMQNIPETNYDIAVTMSNQGKMRDAIVRLKLALWLAPNYVQALYLLGCCYIAVGKKAEAKEQLKKLVALEPDHEHGNFMLATLDPAAVAPERYPTTIPLAIAQDYFANNALEYEAVQQDLGYKGHQYADEALWDRVDRRRTNYQVLELGCGTGLAGVLLAEHAEELVGVDFSREMLDIASVKRRPDGRRVYTETLLQDIRHFAIDANEPRFDGVVAAHVFNYIGEIGMIFDGVMRCLNAGGHFVFQVERFGLEGRFGLVPERAQFGHSDGYIRGHLQRVGFQLLANDVVMAYPDREMVQYVARKPE